METPLHECGLCFNELVFGFCENCSCRLCEKCFSNHKKVTMFIDHTLFPFDKSTQSANILVERTPDIHKQKCSIHLTDANSFYCEKDDATICGRCMHADHRACLDDIIDLNNVKHDENGTTELTNTLKQLEEEISGIDSCVAENLKLNDECKETCLKDITDYTKKLHDRLDLLREKAVKNVNVKHTHNDTNIRTVENLCKEAKERIMKKSDLIYDLSHKKHERHLFVVSKRLGKEVDEIKTIIRQSNLENNIAMFSFLPNRTVECTFQYDFNDIRQLQETCDGSEEVVEDFPEICNESKDTVVDADFAHPQVTVSVSVDNINQLEREIEQLKTQLRTANAEIEGLEGQVEELKKRSGNQRDKISRLEDKVRAMTIDRTVMQSTIEQLKSNMANKDDFIQQLKADLASIHRQQKKTTEKKLEPEPKTNWDIPVKLEPKPRTYLDIPVKLEPKPRTNLDIPVKLELEPKTNSFMPVKLEPKPKTNWCFPVSVCPCCGCSVLGIFCQECGSKTK